MITYLITELSWIYLIKLIYFIILDYFLIN